jgi:hypothetical protein
LFGLFVHTHLGGKPVGWQWLAVVNTFCRQANARIPIATTHPNKCCDPCGLSPSMIHEIDNLVVTHHRLITPVGVIEGSRGLSEATPPDIVAG